ncbi:ATP-binding protein [Halalkalibacter sp. APA_J-10(15)]|uniref:ATP-binding protein n=1 Tax=Halalkalibacter sp. APA_J-10(15) TaxID=2933805 RepID=UPI001FF3A8A7|nr:ATP-binding protein [Halalkalibacter sp. APA_J-10(15)]MCK0473927.1 MEDS domain-containing protein [Halalkalibacter sp. APA_J-10(15)]
MNKTVTKKTIPLTKKLTINEGAHVLYVYYSEELYLENLVSAIVAAKSVNQHVIIIEKEEIYQAAIEKTKMELSVPNEEELDFVHFINSVDYYQTYGDFHFERAIEYLNKLFTSYAEKNISVRVWGNVYLENYLDNMDQLQTYECQCDQSSHHFQFLTICSYDAKVIPSAVQLEMMNSHPYLMTDIELVKSPLYMGDAVLPSLASQKKIESELELYRQKLDFIHVIAHEVRNPLTVIKSFATILKTEVNHDDSKVKLELIEDYAKAIDHEINHMIQTEQMLTVDSFWEASQLEMIPIINEVVESMSVKARTQNIKLDTNINLPHTTQVRGNAMGMKLVISNLLSNAIKYSYEGSSVTLTSFVQNDFLYIQVIDRGVGMNEEEIDKLFKKYQKVNQDVPGQGVGLFMVYKLVNYFNGDIHVESEERKGTKMEVSFPLSYTD